MNKNYNETNSTNESIWVYLFVTILTIWLWIPILLGCLLAKAYFVFINSKNKKIFYWVCFASVSIAIFVASIWFYANYQSLLTTNGILAQLGYLLLSISGIALSLSNLFLTLVSKRVWDKNEIQKEKQEILKKEMLKSSYISNDYFKKEKRFKKFIFSFEIFDRLKANENKELQEAIDKSKYIYLDDEHQCKIEQKVLSQHSLVVGTTGTGKTNTLLHIVKNGFENKNKVIFIDGKADEGLIVDLQKFCLANNKKLEIVSLNKVANRIAYSPFSGKSTSEIISILCEMDGFSDSVGKNSDSAFYKRMEKSVLDFIIPIMVTMKVGLDFSSLYEWTNYETIKEKLSDETFWEKYFRHININTKDKSDKNKKRIKDKQDSIRQDFFILKKDHWQVINTKFLSYRNAFNGIISASGRTIKSILDRNCNTDCLLISLDPMGDSVSTKILANLITYDLKNNSSYNQTQGHTDLIFDELGSYASNSIVELLTQGRSKLYRVHIGVQGISQLENVSKTFAEIVMNNTNTKIIMRVNERSTEDIASFFGTKSDVEITHRVDGEGENLNLAGSGSFKAVERFVIHPNVIKNLGPGEAVVSTLIDGKPFTYPKPIKIQLIKTIDTVLNKNNSQVENNNSLEIKNLLDVQVDEKIDEINNEIQDEINNEVQELESNDSKQETNEIEIDDDLEKIYLEAFSQTMKKNESNKTIENKKAKEIKKESLKENNKQIETNENEIEDDKQLTIWDFDDNKKDDESSDVDMDS